MATAVEELTEVSADDPRWAEAGVTYRMLDYWTTQGYLHVTNDTGNPGSGYQRRWPPGEIDVASRIVRLKQAGLVLEVAAAVARQGFGIHALGPGIEIVVGLR